MTAPSITVFTLASVAGEVVWQAEKQEENATSALPKRTVGFIGRYSEFKKAAAGNTPAAAEKGLFE
ncbi:hypothetical protein GCM10027299_35930 [Larkinella ripae]